MEASSARGHTGCEADVGGRRTEEVGDDCSGDLPCSELQLSTASTVLSCSFSTQRSRTSLQPHTQLSASTN